MTGRFNYTKKKKRIFSSVLWLTPASWRITV